MSNYAVEAKNRRDMIARIRERVDRAMHRESERDVDVAQDRLDLRIRAAVSLVLDEELEDASRWLGQAEAMDREQEAAQAEARR